MKTPNQKTGSLHFSQSGFTLMELMISMALTALLLTTLSAGIYTVVNDWRQETNVLDETLDQSLAILQIDRSLLGAFPHSYVHQERLERVVYFQGETEALSWVSTVSPFRDEGLTAWRLESDLSDGVQLKLTPAFGDNPGPRLDEATPSAVLDNYTATFRYLIQRNEDEKEWVDEWPGEEVQSLPRAVHILLEPIDRNAGDEPLEILAPIRNWQHEDIQPNIPVV